MTEPNDLLDEIAAIAERFAKDRRRAEGEGWQIMIPPSPNTVHAAIRAGLPRVQVQESWFVDPGSAYVVDLEALERFLAPDATKAPRLNR